MNHTFPWAGWEGGDLGPQLPEGVQEEADEVLDPEPELAPKKGRNKRGVPGQETLTFHGKQMTDYQETFIPKTCVHNWTGHTQGVSVIRLLPQTSHLLLSGSIDTKLNLWDVYTSGACLRTFMGHNKAVKDVTFSNDGRKILSCGYDRQMRLWDAETGQCLKRFSNGKIIRYSVPSNDKQIIQYDMDSGEIVQEYDQHLGPVNTITFVDDSRDQDFVVSPQSYTHLGTQDAVDLTIITVITKRNNPVFFVEIKHPINFHLMRERQLADKHMRERFEAFSKGELLMPALYGLSVFGTAFCTYRFDAMTESVIPPKIPCAPGKGRTDTAPIGWWNHIIMCQDGGLKLLELVNEVREMTMKKKRELEG
ncbi:WD40-repeat-containing domain protein [Gautieria morchelliformis]|nr:WD40-repeat-containing domain protein [Gautieria morchelliformis]